MIRSPQEDDWDSHWSKYASSASENPAQYMRYRLIITALKSISWPARRLLDIGSGHGDFLARAVRLGAAGAYVGFEQSERGISISRSKVPEAEFLQIDLYSPPQQSAKFLNWASIAVCSEVIEHVVDPVAFLRATHAYLEEGAVLIITVPGGPISAFDRHIGHRRHYSDSLLRETLTQAGYTVEKIWLGGFPFFNLYRLLVIARGRRLINDVQESGIHGVGSGRLARFVMRAFQSLLMFNLQHFPFGWQILAIARRGKS